MTVAIYRKNLEGNFRYLSREEELAAWERGDNDLLIRSQLPWVLRLAGKMAARWKFRDLELLISAGNLAVIECLETFDPRRARLTTYAAQKIFWKMRTEVRKQRQGVSASYGVRQRTGVKPTAMLGDRIPIVACDDDPVASAASAEHAEMVRKAVADLAEPDSEIMHMRFFEGLTLKEIGERVGLTRERVRQRISRCIGRLRNTLGSLEQWQ